MRKLLNTLYVTTPEAYLSKDGLNVVVSVKQQEVFRIPVVNIEGVVTFGYMGASPGLMKLCSDNGVSLTFLTTNGRFISRVQSKVHGNVLLRKKQYTLSDDPAFCLSVSQNMIAAKIQNYNNVLKRFVRDNGENPDVSEAVFKMGHRKNETFSCRNLDMLRGCEGDAANIYFGVFPHLILNQNADFPFSGRNKRPPKDAVNAMLSFVYTLLATDMTSALETVGLDPYVGFMHAIRPGRASLALDMMEELRAYLGDRLVLSLINRKQVTKSDFITQDSDSVVLTDSAKKTIITAWQGKKKETIIHPYLKEKIQIGLLPYAQAMMMARFIRGDIDGYPPFLML